MWCVGNKIKLEDGEIIESRDKFTTLLDSVVEVLLEDYDAGLSKWFNMSELSTFWTEVLGAIKFFDTYTFYYIDYYNFKFFQLIKDIKKVESNKEPSICITLYTVFKDTIYDLSKKHFSIFEKPDEDYIDPETLKDRKYIYYFLTTSDARLYPWSRNPITLFNVFLNHVDEVKQPSVTIQLCDYNQYEIEYDYQRGTDLLRKYKALFKVDKLEEGE